MSNHVILKVSTCLCVLSQYVPKIVCIPSREVESVEIIIVYVKLIVVYIEKHKKNITLLYNSTMLPRRNGQQEMELGYHMKKLIPSTLTLGNLLMGFSAILLTLKNEVFIAILLIVLGLLFDFFDGYCARMLNAESEFGKELDSLADLTTFGVAPAIVAYVTSLHEIHMLGVFCCLSYACCCALRLARFNTSSSKNTNFVGMPTPLAAILIISTTTLSPLATAVGSLLIAILMVSQVSFPSLKKIKLDSTEDC